MIEIKIRCKECKADNHILLSDLDTGNAPCKGCGVALFFYRGITGFVYVLTNPAMPGMVKIGSTTRSVEERVRELSSATGVPAPFIVETYFESTQPQVDEAKVHKRLQSQRVVDKEFFRVELAAAIEAVRSVIGPGARQSGKQNIVRLFRCRNGNCNHTWYAGILEFPSHPKLCPLCGVIGAQIGAG